MSAPIASVLKEARNLGKPKNRDAFVFAHCDKSVNVRIYRLGAMPLDISGALSPQTAASMNYSRISCSGMFR
jgi:hypothetical protein